MKKLLLIAAAMVLVANLASGQSRKKKVEPVDNSYQVVNVTNEASVCFDTTSKKYDLVVFVYDKGQRKTVQVGLGTEFGEIAANLHAAIRNYNVTPSTVNYVLKYFILYRDMPVGEHVVSLSYCTDYALQLSLALMEYDFESVPITFAISDPNAKIKLKQQISFAQRDVLFRNDLESIKTLIDKGVVKTDQETAFFLKLLERKE